MPSEGPRDKFLQRISTVGGGTREVIQMLLGGIVYDLRDMVERGVFGDEEMNTVVTFHDHTEEFWRRTLVTNPPMDPVLLVAGLRTLSDECSGPLEGFNVRLDQALQKAEGFAATRKRS